MRVLQSERPPSPLPSSHATPHAARPHDREKTHLALEQLDAPARRVERHRLYGIELPVTRMAREEDLADRAAPDEAQRAVGREVGAAVARGACFEWGGAAVVGREGEGQGEGRGGLTVRMRARRIFLAGSMDRALLDARCMLC